MSHPTIDHQFPNWKISKFDDFSKKELIPKFKSLLNDASLCISELTKEYCSKSERTVSFLPGHKQILTHLDENGKEAFLDFHYFYVLGNWDGIKRQEAITAGCSKVIKEIAKNFSPEVQVELYKSGFQITFCEICNNFLVIVEFLVIESKHISKDK